MVGEKTSPVWQKQKDEVYKFAGFAMGDIVNNTVLHLNVWQTPLATELVA
jgi:hypothetical protein